MPQVQDRRKKYITKEIIYVNSKINLLSAPDSDLLLLQEKEVPGNVGEVFGSLYVVGTPREQHSTGGEALVWFYLVVCACDTKRRLNHQLTTSSNSQLPAHLTRCCV